VVVYNPCYEPFIAWAKATLGRGGQAAYQRAARLPRTDLPLHEQLDLRFIPQRGRYADVTSVLNGADHLRTAGDLFVAFADNLYPHDNPCLALAAVPAGHTAVLVRHYHSAEAARRGVIVTRVDGADPGQPQDDDADGGEVVSRAGIRWTVARNNGASMRSPWRVSGSRSTS